MVTVMVFAAAAAFAAMVWLSKRPEPQKVRVPVRVERRRR